MKGNITYYNSSFFHLVVLECTNNLKNVRSQPNAAGKTLLSMIVHIKVYRVM